MSVRLGLSLFACLGALAACSESPTAPANSGSLDVAALLAEMSPASLGAAEDLSGATVSVRTTGAATIDPGQCTYSADSGWFGCPSVTINGITFTRMFRLIDASGNSQSKPDAQTSAIETKTTLSGQVTSTFGNDPTSSGSYTINSISQQILSDLRAENHRLNGVTTTTIKGSFTVGQSTIPIDDTQRMTILDLILPNAAKGQRWPRSGSVTIDDMPNSATEFLTRIVIIFDGTSTVTMTMTTPFGTSTCHFDMASMTGCVP